MDSPPKDQIPLVSIRSITLPPAGTQVGASFDVTFTGQSNNQADYRFYLITGVPNNPVKVVATHGLVAIACDLMGLCTGTMTITNAPASGQFFFVQCDASDNVLDVINLKR